MLFLQLLQAFPSLKDDELVKIYAAKALAVSSTPLERRTSTSTVTPAVKPITRTITPTARSNFNSGLNTLQRRAFSWTTRDTGNKIINPDNSSRKRKIAGVLPPSHKAAWEALAGVPEERTPAGLTALEGYERPAPMTITEEWVLTGDPTKDGGVRNSHRYESAPSSILFKVRLHKISLFHSAYDFLGFRLFFFPSFYLSYFCLWRHKRQSFDNCLSDVR